MANETTNTWTIPAGSAYKLYMDMLSQYHVLIAGAAGSGKSVVENALIYTALFDAPCDVPGGKQFIFIDNGKGTEMIDYQNLPHTLRYAYTLDESISALEYGLAIAKSRFKDMRQRHIKTYDGGDVYIFIDEFASLILNGRRRVSAVVQDIAQLGRAAKVHLILCTQSPLAKVLPTEIKVNFDARLALKVHSAQDSRNILGFKGCETLPRYGKGYYMTPDGTKRYIVHKIDDEDIAERVQWWENQKQNQPKRPFREVLHDVVGMLIVILNGNLLK